MRKIIVNEKYNNKKLNSFILDSFPNLNKNALYKALRKKDIRVNGKRVSDDVTVYAGDEITIFIIDDFLFGTSNINIEVVFEDDNIMVINKPDNMSVTDDNIQSKTLTTIVKEKFGNNLEPCHRLDRNTKGLIIYAKNKESLDILFDKFKNKEIEKHYYTKVYGNPKKDHDLLKAYLFKDSKKSLVYISDIPKNDYLEIITEYTVLNKDIKNNVTYLDINLHTGRTHQIRAHLSHIGLPVIGDGKYGINEINKKFGLKNQFLYSYKLKFNFKNNNGILDYLNGKEIVLKNLPK